MTKKIGAVLILSVLLSSGAFAVPDLFNLKSGPTPQKNTVFVDVGTMLVYLIADGFGIGVGYERAFGDSWTGLIHAAAGGYTYDSSAYIDSSAFAFAIDVHGRWYFFKTALDKAFVDLGLGYDYYGYTYKDETNWNWSQSSLTITPKVGWKFIFWKGFVVEPSFGYTIGIPLGTPERHGAAAYVPGDFNIGLALGWAF